jgi:hypothetical protein
VDQRLSVAAVLDELHVMGAFDASETKEGKVLLHRIVTLVTNMTRPVDRVREDSAEYGFGGEESYDVQGIDCDYAHEHECEHITS